MQIPVWDNKNRQPRRASLQQVTDMATAGAAASAAEAAASAAEAAASIPTVNRDDYDDLRSYAGAATTAFVLASGIAGTFVRDATVTVDNGGTEIVGVHGWRRVWDGPVQLKWFGSTGNASGDDAVFQAALDFMHKLSDDTGIFGTLEFEGTVYLATPKNFGKNIKLAGRGRGFRSTLKPSAAFVGGYLLGIDGDNCIGGYAFRIRHDGFTIDNSLITTKAQLPLTYKINKAYDVLLRDVWVYNARGTGIQVGQSNLVIIENPSIYGVSASAADSEYGIRVMSGGAGGGGGGVKIINPDIEVFFHGIRQEADSRVQVVNPYCERNIIGWVAAGGVMTGAMTVVGGEVESPGASGVAASIAGNNVTVIGGMYEANGGAGLVVDSSSRRENIHLIGVAGDITDSRNYARRTGAETTRWYGSSVRNQKDVADAAVTTFYSIVCPSNAGYFGVCEVTLNARDNSGYSLWTAKYRFAFSNPDGTLRVTAVTEYGKTNINASANYSLAITCAAPSAGSTISFQVTADSGGALGNGQSPRISTQAELVQWDSAGAIYIQAA
jgi:hypothetical protein